MTTIRPAASADLDAIAALAAPLQADPARFQAYFGDAPDEIAAEITELEDWADRTVVAVAGSADGERIVGWLFGEHDDEIGRVWWWGPVVDPDHDWMDVGRALHAASAERDGDRFTEFEFAVDRRHSPAAQLAEELDFRRDTGSVLLELDVTNRPAGRPGPDGVAISDDLAGSGDDLAALHDSVFPNSHLTGPQVVASAAGDVVLAARRDGRLVGYVRAEIQPGGGGYVDFLGVTEDERSHGIGGALVEAAVARLVERGAMTVSLTVREDNPPARALYERLGFDGSRILVPFRLGFTT